VRLLGQRLAAAWYGPIAGLIALAFILFVPMNHQCFGVTGARGSPSGDLCFWSTGIAGSSSLFVVAFAVLVALGVQLLSTDPRFQVAVGLLTTALWLVILFELPNYNVGYWASVHGIEYTGSNLDREFLLMLPSGLLPLIAGIKRLRRQSTGAPAAS
jgi:hypothetical protein